MQRKAAAVARLLSLFGLLSLGPGLPLSVAEAGECYDKLVKICDEGAAQSNQGLSNDLTAARNMGGGTQSESAQAEGWGRSSANYAQSARRCRAECKECEKYCKNNPHEIRECERVLKKHAAMYSHHAVANGMNALAARKTAVSSAANGALSKALASMVPASANEAPAAVDSSGAGVGNVGESVSPAPEAAQPTNSSTGDTLAGMGIGNMNSANCSSSGAYKNEQCAAILTIACAAPSQAGTPLCVNFAGQYCGPGGAGVGHSDGFCQAHNTFQFCNNPAHPEAMLCPSCAKTQMDGAFSSGVSLPAICQTDPAHLSGSRLVAAAAVGNRSAPANAMPSESRGSPSGSDPSAGSDPKGPPGAAPDKGAIAVAGLTGGPGRVGAPSEGDAEEDSLSLEKKELGAAGGRTVASTGILVSDVMDRFGPNVFLISSQVLRTRCQLGKLMHCGPSK